MITSGSMSSVMCVQNDSLVVPAGEEEEGAGAPSSASTVMGMIVLIPQRCASQWPHKPPGHTKQQIRGLRVVTY